jgi:exonuclease SbcD
MKFLHTSDWHVGKALKQRSRLVEQRAVLAEIVGLAAEHDVDAVVIAGDLYDHAAPSAAAQDLVVSTLLDLHRLGTEVLAIAGNHDHPETFEAYRPLMLLAGIHLAGHVRAPDNGGVVSFTARSTGEPVNVATMPFLPARHVVRAAQVAAPQAENTARYDEAHRQILHALATGFRDDAVNIVTAHVTILNASAGGGERPSQSVADYVVPATIFPIEAHYVALGHLHRRQKIPAGCPVHYSGAPIAVDFGEVENTPQVLLVEAGIGTPAVVTDIPITSGRRLRTVRGAVEEVLTVAEEYAADYLNVVLTELPGPGDRERLAQALPDLIHLRRDPSLVAPRARTASDVLRSGATAQELFDRYCADTSTTNPKVSRLFAELHDEATSTAPAL